MKAQTRGISESFSRMRLGRALVVAQIALTLVLAAAAGLLLATFRNLAAMDPGFRAQGVLLVAADLRSGNLAKPARDALRQEILRRLRELPGVHSAAASLFTPISGMRWNSNIRVDRAEVRPGRESIVFFNALSPGYFETLGTALIAGRDFNDGDTAGSPKVAIVNETTAQKFFGKASPLGHRLRYRGPRGWSDAHEIVGLVRDAKYRSLREAVPPTAYFPLTQSEDFGGANFEVRIAGSPGSLVNAIKSVMADVNPGLNLTFLPLSTQIAESLTRERLLATLSGFFGALALLLAAIGLYGVLSYNVARRRNEIGIRMALGAARARVLTMILGEAGWLAGAGLGLGLAGTLAATHLVSAFLYGLNPNDPATLAAAVALLLAVAGIASYLPARRAAMLDPMVTLREE
jgi:predicted permease